MFKLLNGRTSFYQWDTNQKLIIDTDIPDYQVHFQDIFILGCNRINL